jgi:hypothetical protein
MDPKHCKKCPLTIVWYICKLEKRQLTGEFFLLELVGGESGGCGEQLMAETDAEYWARSPPLTHHPPQLLHCPLTHLTRQRNGYYQRER